jgi:hypothetical protein
MVTNPHTKGASNNSKQAGNEQEDISEVGNNKQQEDRSKAVADISDDGEVSMVDYDKIVYDITGGPPLAIAVLAGLVRHRESDLERKAVLDQLKPPCPMDKIFAASYDDLSQDLKSCFLYFAAYTKNIAQPADHIVRMWMAEGFVKPRNGRTPEELGHMYLLELASRRLVTRVGMELFILHSSQPPAGVPAVGGSPGQLRGGPQQERRPCAGVGSPPLRSGRRLRIHPIHHQIPQAEDLHMPCRGPRRGRAAARWEPGKHNRADH